MIKSTVFTEDTLCNTAVQYGIDETSSILRKLIEIGGHASHKDMDVIFLRVEHADSDFSKMLFGLDFSEDETDPRRYRLLHRNYEKLFIVETP